MLDTRYPIQNLSIDPPDFKSSFNRVTLPPLRENQKLPTTFIRGKSNVKFECTEPVVIDVLWEKVATKVGTFLDKSMNLVPTFPHGPQIVKL